MANTQHTRAPLLPLRRTVDASAQDGAVMLAAALGLALDNAALRPGCARCVAREKAAGKDVPTVRYAVTWQDGQPVCYEDYEVDGG